MYKGTCTNLMGLSREQVRQWLNSFDTIISDCDGVIWLGNNVIEGAAPTMDRLMWLGKRIFLCTNNSTKTRQQLVEKSRGMGFDITIDHIISTAHSTAAYLKSRNFQGKVYIIGPASIADELEDVGIRHIGVGPDVMSNRLSDYLATGLDLDPEVGAVVVGFDTHFSFCKIIKAAMYLNDPKCLFIATNTDERFPLPDFVIPDAGTIVRTVQTCSVREPIVVGKPSRSICEWLIKNKTIEPARTLMMGDCCDSDILLGHACGFQTLLIGTGIHNLNDVEAWKRSEDPEDKKFIPDMFVPKLGNLLEFL